MDRYVDMFVAKYESFLTGCDAIEELGLWNKEKLGEMEAFYSNDIVSIIIRLIACDDVISEKEVQYLNETFGFEYTLEELCEVYNSCKDDIVSQSFDENFENGISYMRELNEKLANSYKELLSLICDIIIKSDGIVSESELLELNKLKEMCN